jgi:hypothetical protein
MTRVTAWLRCRDENGPPPRSLAAEANDCFMVRIAPRSDRIQGCGAMLRAQLAGSPRFVDVPPIHLASVGLFSQQPLGPLKEKKTVLTKVT